MSASWEEYQAAAQRLDAVRRGAATAAGEQAKAVQTARDELTGVRARLAPQHSRLRDAGVPEAALRPSPADLAAATRAVADGPEAVLAALRQARATADSADAALVGSGADVAVLSRTLAGIGGSPARLRNLVVYGPFALVVLVVQLALYLMVSGESLPVAAVLCGLAMPAAAFGLGWLTVGIVFPPGPDGRVDRTAGFGAVVSAAPILLTCLGAGALRILG
jgi:hypothetical protein